MTVQIRNVLIVSFLVVLVMASNHVIARDASSVPTELWVTGDDALTQRFAQELRVAIASSKKFAAPTSNNKDGLVLTVPTNLHVQEIDGKTNFHYVVVFLNQSSTYLGVSSGACWTRSLPDCVAKVVQDAEWAWFNRREVGG